MPKVYTEQEWEQSLEDRFWGSVKKMGPDDCWEWVGHKTNHGHPVLTNGRRRGGVRQSPIYAHRFIFELTHGPILDGRWIDHACCNRGCVNPSHLRVCTPSQNAQNRKRGNSNTSGFKGVSFWVHQQKWTARIRCGDNREFLGYFDTPDEAYVAYCEAATRMHGEFANFGGVA